MKPAQIGHDDTIIEGAAEDVTAARNLADDDERAILEEFGAAKDQATWKIKIYKMPSERGQTRGWIEDITPSQLPYLAKLRRMAGPGSYQGWCYRGGERSPRKILKWEIAELLTQPEEKQATAQESALTQAVAGILAIQKDVVQQLAEMKRAPAAPAAPQSSMAEMMQGFAAVMAAMRELQPPAPKAPDQMALLTNVIGLVKDLQGADREKSTLEIIADMFSSGAFGELIKTMQQQQQPALPQPGVRRALPPGVRPAAPPHPHAPQPDPAPQPPAAGVVHPFAEQLEILLNGARQDADPVSFADVVLVTVDRNALNQLLALPDPVGVLVQLNPNIEPFRKWFEEFFAALTDDGEEDDNAGDAAGRDAPAFGTGDHSERSGGGEDDSEDDEGEG